MKWGSRLEDAIAKGVAEDNQWKVEPFKIYGRMPNLRAGSSFDYKILHYEGDGILEIKNVDSLQFKEKWLFDGGKLIEAPPHIELQCQHQMMVSGLKYLKLAALVGGNTVGIIEREYDEELISEIQSRIYDFWELIDKDKAPEPNFEKDYEAVIRMMQSAEPGKIIDGTSEIEALVDLYNKHSEQEKAAAKKKKQIKATIFSLIGDAEKVNGSSYSIIAGLVGPSEVSFTREGYRNFRVYNRKPKTGD
jgi:predicted phage-related endonuclease